ncbi:MAG TPA: carboxymuconolactone decarboxylase family protein [Alphaproteobacteria bacterium]|nr:carboxymuconolactone decarboxylase family protein [Alphaproteobacteria bacterium]
MKQRIHYHTVAPKGVEAMRGLQAYVDASGLEHALVELVKTRASQINGCAYCVDLHTRDARKAGEREERLYALAVWRESPLFSARERAALAWCEAVTLISHDHVPDAVFEEVRAHFSEKELVDLTFAIVAINGWNRLAVSFRQMPVARTRAAAAAQ